MYGIARIKHSCSRGANPACHCRNSESDASLQIFWLFLLGFAKSSHLREVKSQHLPVPRASQQRCSAAHVQCIHTSEWAWPRRAMDREQQQSQQKQPQQLHPVRLIRMEAC